MQVHILYQAFEALHSNVHIYKSLFYINTILVFVLLFVLRLFIVLSEINGIDSVMVRFKGEQAGWSPQGLHKTEIQFTDLTETDGSN
jgi:hypothetical protein